MRTKKRRARIAPCLSGFTLVEVVLVFGILGITAAIVAPPVIRFLDIYKTNKVREELKAIAAALESYWEEKHATGTWDDDYGFFPTSLAASDFLGAHLQTGPDRDIITDEFGVNTHYTYIVYGGTPCNFPHSKLALVVSAGPNKVIETSPEVSGGCTTFYSQVGGADDILVPVSANRIGIRLTRKKLAALAKGAHEYILGTPYTSATNVWDIEGSTSVASSYFGMSSWYDKDGWGNSWMINDEKYRIYSKGPDGVDDTGSTSDSAFEDDDIGW